MLINWAARRGIVSHAKRLEEMTDAEMAGLYIPSERPPAGLQTVSPASVDTLALHLALVGVAMLIGMGIKLALVWVEQWMPWFADGEVEIMGAFPLFPLCMLGGLVLFSGMLLLGALLGVYSIFAWPGAVFLAAFTGLGFLLRTIHPRPPSLPAWLPAFYAAIFMAAWCHLRTWPLGELHWRGITYRVGLKGRVLGINK